MQTKITTKRLLTSKAKAQDIGKAIYLWDSELKGFGCWLSPTGSVSWLVQAWQGGAQGKTTRVHIGKYPALTLDEAREEARPILHAAFKGQDISSKKRKAQVRQRIEAPTLEEAVDRYIQAHFIDNRYWNETAARLRTKLIAPLGGKTKLLDITKHELKGLFANGQAGKVHLFASLRPFFRWCEQEELVKTNPLALVAAPKQFEARSRTLSDPEIRVFWLGCGQLGYPYGSLYRLLLTTGQRLSETGNLRWREIDGDTWILPSSRTKNGQENQIHLSSLSLEIIEGLPSFAKGREYLFTPPKSGGLKPVCSWSPTKVRLDTLVSRVMEIEEWHLHDLRRTCASGMAKLGIAPHVTDRLLNHQSTPKGMIGVYQRYSYLEERKEALSVWGNYLKSLISTV